jgi:hypothetical protein
MRSSSGFLEASLALGFAIVSMVVITIAFRAGVAHEKRAGHKLILTCQMKPSPATLEYRSITVRNIDEFMVQGANLVAFFDTGQQVIQRNDVVSCITNTTPGE